VCHSANISMIVVTTLTVLGTIVCSVAAQSQTVEELLQREHEQQQQQLDRIVKLTKPLAECVKKQAHELVSSAEKADVVARAAVGLCSKEEAAYRAALLQLAIIVTGFDADTRAQRMHQQLVEMALTIIVNERQHLPRP
jgi:hypothetical protein